MMFPWAATRSTLASERWIFFERGGISIVADLSENLDILFPIRLSTCSKMLHRSFFAYTF